MPAAPPNYWVRNCIAASAAGQPAPVLPPVPGPNADLTSCAWVPVGAPPPLANLRITKSPLTCHKQGPATVRCNYEIVILNNGPSPSTNLITFTETVPPSSTLASIAAPWACVGGPPGYTCTTAAAPVIAPGDHLTIPVSIDLDRAPLEAAKCWAPNTVTITVPVGGTNQNFDAADDTSVATADAAWIRFDEGGPLELVLCDPTNLATKKVATGNCETTADGTENAVTTSPSPIPDLTRSRARSTSRTNSALRRPRSNSAAIGPAAAPAQRAPVRTHHSSCLKVRAVSLPRDRHIPKEQPVLDAKHGDDGLPARQHALERQQRE